MVLSRWCCTAASRGARARATTRHAAPSPSQVLDSLHRLAEAQSHRPPDFLSGYAFKTRSESIDGTLRRRRILFAGFVARMEDTRLPKCAMFGEMVGGTGCVGGQEKQWMGCFLDDLRAFGINADQWTTAVQGKGEWHRTVKQGAEHFMAKWTCCRESQGWTTACSGMPERDRKDQGEDS